MKTLHHFLVSCCEKIDYANPRILMKKASIVFDFSGTLAYERDDFSLALFPSILWLLENLKEEGHELYLWTALSRKGALQSLEKLGIQHFFTDLRTPSDCAGKPDPEGLKQMLVNVDKKLVVVIGDSYGDMFGAKLFGAFAIGAVWKNGYGSEQLQIAGASVIAQDAKDCYQIINDYLKN